MNLLTRMLDHLGLNPKIHAGIKFHNTYLVECFDKDGNLKWTETASNLVTNEGLNDVLNKYFKGSTYTAAWYVLLKGTGTIAAADTLASHAGWTEFVSFSGSNRPAWGPAAAASGVMANTTLFTYTLSATGTLAGGFVTSGQAKSGTSGTLWATALQTRSVTNGDTLSGSYTITLTPSS